MKQHVRPSVWAVAWQSIMYCTRPFDSVVLQKPSIMFSDLIQTEPSLRGARSPLPAPVSPQSSPAVWSMFRISSPHRVHQFGFASIANLHTMQIVQNFNERYNLTRCSTQGDGWDFSVRSFLLLWDIKTNTAIALLSFPDELHTSSSTSLFHHHHHLCDTHDTSLFGKTRFCQKIMMICDCESGLFKARKSSPFFLSFFLFKLFCMGNVQEYHLPIKK